MKPVLHKLSPKFVDGEDVAMTTDHIVVVGETFRNDPDEHLVWAYTTNGCLYAFRVISGDSFSRTTYYLEEGSENRRAYQETVRRLGAPHIAFAAGCRMHEALNN